MNNYFLPIFENETANATGESLSYAQPSSPTNFMAWGVFDGASIYLEWSIDGVTWVRFKQNGVDLVWTTSDMFFAERIDTQMRIRGVIEGVGASTNVSMGYAIS